MAERDPPEVSAPPRYFVRVTLCAKPKPRADVNATLCKGPKGRTEAPRVRPEAKREGRAEVRVGLHNVCLRAAGVRAGAATIWNQKIDA